MQYGLDHKRLDHPRPRDLIGRVETSQTGNVILTIGHENGPTTWEKIGHIVLTPVEATTLGAVLIARATGAAFADE